MPFLVRLSQTEFRDAEQLARSTSRELDQFASWLLRMALARRLRIAPGDDDADDLSALETWPPSRSA